MGKQVEVEVVVGWSDGTSTHVRVGHRTSAAGIASEAEARAAFLRSRSLSKERNAQRREWLLLAELHALAARARVAALAERRGIVSEAAARVELDALGTLSFATFRRFEEFVAALGAPFPMRTTRQEPAARAAELAAIERFLAERK